MAKLISDFFCVAMSGKTVDGREIKPDWLLEAAKSYNADFYAARIWFEHIRYYGAMGDVFAVKTEQDDKGIVRMYNRIIPSPELVYLKNNSRALYSSIEVVPKLERTGKAYQIGLGVTDSPASFGTDRLEFAVRHLEPESLFTTELELQGLEFSTQRSLFDFGRFRGRNKTEEQLPEPRETHPESSVEDDDMTPEEYKQAAGEVFQQQKQELATLLAEKLTEATTPLLEKLTAQQQELDALKEKQDKVIELATPIAGNGHQDREPHNGGDSEQPKFDY